ncbi:MAG: family 78 glycoside hydrolase catalytic domain [Clostridia bacterium]|nr:family 78 glycoside hydrolase catalytic domain [Clostridia bacterium]
MITITRTYKKEYLDGEIGKIICAPHSLSARDYDRTREETELPLGKYIWNPSYTRAHYRRDIEIDGSFDKVLAQFCCDNSFIIFVNGRKAYDSRDFFPIGEYASSGVIELTEYFTEGTNKIAITAFQTGTFDRFLSAMRGVFAIERDGKREYIPTDESFRYVVVCGFWDDKEDEGWETADTFRGTAHDVYPDHPSTLRRSFYVRKSFDVRKDTLSRATLRATAYGLYVPFVNGKCATEERFLPGAMDGCKEYRDFDITSLLFDGKNAVGAIIGNGWYNCTAFGILSTNRLGFAAEIILENTDGSVTVIPTDNSWLCNNSPIYEDDIQFGERYDARREIPDWCLANFDSDGWVNAEEAEFSHKPYSHQSYPPIRVTKTLSHTRKWDIGDNRIIFDFGSNNAARARFTVKNAKCGDKFRIRYAERIPDGEPHLGVYGDVYYISDTFRNGTARGALRNCDLYICRGDNVEVYEPRFAYTGFRYIYIEYPEGFDVENITVEARVIHNDLEICGSINTSYTPLCHIWEMICRSFTSNIVGGPTDCPTREKNFWNGDIQIFCYTAMWYADVNDFLSRWTDVGRKIQRGIYGWEDEEYILPYKLYKFYGNTDILRVKYPVMLGLIEKREQGYEKHGNFVPHSARYRDHLSIVNVSHDFFAHCWHAFMYKMISEISEILGYTDKANELLGKWEEWKASFNEKYFLESEGNYSENCQGGIILPIMLGLAPEEKIPALVERLVKYIEEDKGPTTGFLTTECLLMVLSEHGYHDLAHDIMTRDTYPSWLYLWKTGSTTITESWRGEAAPYDESMNHYAFGSVGRYFFEALGGLKNHSGDMKHFDICPEICEKIGDFGVSYRTPHGTVSTFWKVNGRSGTLEVTLPDGVSATVTTPDGEITEICESRTFEFRL